MQDWGQDHNGISLPTIETNSPACLWLPQTSADKRTALPQPEEGHTEGLGGVWSELNPDYDVNAP